MFELRVLTGLHRGAALPLCGNAWRIGAADDADLVLYDPGIAPYHGQLEKTADGWALSAQDGALCNAEGHTVEQIDALPPGTPFALGQIWLCIVAADTPGLTTAKRLQPQKKMFPCGTIRRRTASSYRVAYSYARATPAAVGQSQLSAAWRIAAGDGRQLATTGERRDACRPAAAGYPQTAQHAATARKHAAHHVAGAGTERGRESGGVSGSRHAHRTINAGRSKKLERMLAQLHQRYRTALSVDNRTQLKTEQLPFQIVQVTSGSRANVVTADGQRFFIGDEIDNLRLVKIDEHQIEFSGRQQITVNW